MWLHVIVLKALKLWSCSICHFIRRYSDLLDSSAINNLILTGQWKSEDFLKEHNWKEEDELNSFIKDKQKKDPLFAWQGPRLLDVETKVSGNTWGQWCV